MSWIFTVVPTRFISVILGFDDTCELSAVLGIISSASVFTPDVRDLSKEVKNDVRNKWGHCNFLEWDETKFKICFQLIDSLLQALKLPLEDAKRVADELQDWETKGNSFHNNYMYNIKTHQK